jgi:hypothetical protein
MMTKGGGSKSPTKLKKRMSVDMNNEDNAMPPQSAAANGLSFALKPRPAIRRNAPSANPAQRRILSLSQISGNAPTGAQAYPTSNPATNNGGGLGRSHSVKTTNSARKGSWGGRPSALGPVANKENGGLNEATAPITHAIIEEDAQSETGTERRYSIDSRSYPESYAEGETPGYDGTGSEYTYNSGSYMTGSDIDNDRRTSYGAQSARSGAPPQETIDEGSVYSDDDEPTLEVKPLDINPSEISTATADSEVDLPTQSEINLAVEAVKNDLKENFAPPSDSGVGTDLPTAALELEAGPDADYFRRAAEEEASTVG